MALELTVTLPNGAAGNYLRIGQYEWSQQHKAAYAELALFKDQAQADAKPGFPLAVVGILNLRGSKFDEYFSKPALASAATEASAGSDIVRYQFYKAARREALAPANSLLVENVGSAVDV